MKEPVSLRPVGLLVLLAALLPGACSERPQATPFPELPALERPVAKVTARKDSNISVPRAALVERGGIPGVFVLSAEGQARFRMVKPGRMQGPQVEVLSGLRGHEVLVLGDLKPVHDGSPIQRRGG